MKIIKQYCLLITLLFLTTHTMINADLLKTELSTVVQELSNAVRQFQQAYQDNAPYSLFKDATKQNSILLGRLKAIKQDAHNIAQGKLDEHSLAIQFALQGFFDAIDNIRMYMSKTIPNSSNLINSLDGVGDRAQEWLPLKDRVFKSLDKKIIDGYVNEMKSAQKKMNSKFGFFSSPSLKSSVEKEAYSNLKKVVKTVNDMIDMLTTGPYASLKELYNLIKK